MMIKGRDLIGLKNQEDINNERCHAFGEDNFLIAIVAGWRYCSPSSVMM